MKSIYKKVTGTCVLVLSSSLFATDIGVIPDTDCPVNSETIRIYMDDEDTRNNSRQTGWVGATHGSTAFRFCRINGDIFEPLSNNEDYAVLKLSDSCPNNSIEFDRYFDNEDNRNNNQSTGNIYPNIVNGGTNLKFCYFKGASQGMSSFPDVGVEYGVFAPRIFSKSLASGTIYTDDEDNNNRNRLNVHGHTAIKSIIYGERNTVLNVHKVTAQSSAVDYAAYGSYTPIREDVSQRISIYKPKKDGAFKLHSPVVIVGTGGWGGTGRKQEEFINFIVSKGYFVIGVGTSSDRDAEFNRILGALNNQGNLVDKTKIGLMGSSTGGGTIFYNLKRLKDNGYATNSFAISLDGWFALGLTPAEVSNLHTTTLLLQFGGADGLRHYGTEVATQYYVDRGTDHYQDHRILMSIYNMLPGNEKALSYLNNDEHAYANESMDGKEDMLNVVGAMLAYKFENGGQAAKNIALNNKYDEINAAKFGVGKYRYGCTENIANQNYNYCDVNNPQ